MVVVCRGERYLDRKGIEVSKVIVSGNRDAMNEMVDISGQSKDPHDELGWGNSRRFRSGSARAISGRESLSRRPGDFFVVVTDIRKTSSPASGLLVIYRKLRFRQCLKSLQKRGV